MLFPVRVLAESTHGKIDLRLRYRPQIIPVLLPFRVITPVRITCNVTFERAAIVRIVRIDDGLAVTDFLERFGCLDLA